IKYGMSEKMGPMVYGENEGEVFLGRSVTRTQNMSEKTMQDIDAEIRRILDEQYALAKQILTDNASKVESMTQALVNWETIDADQVKEIMAGKEPSPPKDYSHNIRKEEPTAENGENAAAENKNDNTETAPPPPPANNGATQLPD
ncbi:MAG: cell division protein FtsH, partial [Neisseriaceae bacterium]|nr:cell division protein FtsH [Neisseriaceae bacterium]